MSETTYFFDTYAFFEILKGNQYYKKFEQAKGITTLFNLAELNFALKREKKMLADQITKKYESLLVDVSTEDVMQAMSFRMQHRKLSIPDAIGYIIAKRHHLKFLTGDKEFKNLPNVEYIK
ncbi:PIN domain-containing protein [Candidatus Micrarchaeota archaeon]|nr:PIN domain-containing protein [Candidatus Micrarchaeota archaeon]MBU1930902.1 PIN domain-containing protein [Candidatus Micrarchaeota archaeon]